MTASKKQGELVNPPYKKPNLWNTEANGKIPYAAAADYIVNHIRTYRASAHTLLDMACGSGGLTFPLARYGFSKVTGIDSSEPMIIAARARALYEAPGVNFFQHDIRNAYREGLADIVTCFCNSIIYLTSKKELIQWLNNVYETLSKGGLLIFDQIQRGHAIQGATGNHSRRLGKIFLTRSGKLLKNGIVKERRAWVFHTSDPPPQPYVEIQKFMFHERNSIQETLTMTGFELILLDNIGKAIPAQHFKNTDLFIAKKVRKK